MPVYNFISLAFHGSYVTSLSWFLHHASVGSLWLRWLSCRQRIFAWEFYCFRCSATDKFTRSFLTCCRARCQEARFSRQARRDDQHHCTGLDSRPACSPTIPVVHRTRGSEYFRWCTAETARRSILIRGVVKHNKYECTIDQELTLARRFMFTHEVSAAFYAKWHHRHRLEFMKSHRKSNSVSRCVLFEEQFCQISPRSDLKRRSLGLFEEVALTTTRRTRTKWVAIWDQFLILEQKAPCMMLLIC